MDKIRDIFSYFVAALAMFAFLGAVYQAFQNEKGSAVTLGTLFLVGALIVFLPQVEFIKTLGVEAKLRQTVTEAVATLENLKRLSQISAKATYMQMAWGTRWKPRPITTSTKRTRS
jgi:glycerol-3-phosphate acyltransferase PlsY